MRVWEGVREEGIKRYLIEPRQHPVLHELTLQLEMLRVPRHPLEIMSVVRGLQANLNAVQDTTVPHDLLHQHKINVPPETIVEQELEVRLLVLPEAIVLLQDSLPPLGHVLLDITVLPEARVLLRHNVL